MTKPHDISVSSLDEEVNQAAEATRQLLVARYNHMIAWLRYNEQDILGARIDRETELAIFESMLFHATEPAEADDDQ